MGRNYGEGTRAAEQLEKAVANMLIILRDLVVENERLRAAAGGVEGGEGNALLTRPNVPSMVNSSKGNGAREE